MQELLLNTIVLASLFTTALIILGIILVVVIVLAMWCVGLYNKLVTSRNRYKKAFADIDVQLKRRHDLIPNLVETAKGYMAHESETLEAVIAARNMANDARKGADAGDSSSMASLAEAESGLGGALSRLMMVTESYPDLKADRQMSELSEELTHTENKVSFSRQAYNGAVTDYNDYRETFPTNIFANMFNFTAAVLFEVTDDSEREAVKVEF